MKIKIIITIFFLNTFICFSQINLVDTSLVSVFDSTNNFYLIKENIQISNNDIVNISNNNLLRINNSNSFSLQKSDTDDVGYIHYNYNQLFNGLQIIGASLNLHCNTNNTVKSINGNIADLKNLNTFPSLNANSAIDYAKSYFPTSTFAWEDEMSEQTVKLEKEDSAASNTPLPILVICYVRGEYKLAYKMNVALASPASNWEVYIDAHTGDLLKKLDNIKSCFKTKDNVTTNNCNNYIANKVPLDVLSCDGYHTGTGSTLYYGSQYIITEKFKPNIFDCKYKLKDDYTGTSLYTRDYNGGNIQDITDQTNNWTFLVTQPGVTTHWCLEMTHDFYRFTYGRNSFNDSYSQMKIYTNANQSGSDNAFWSSSNNSMYIGSGGGGSTYNDLATLDIIGHEFTHGVNDFEANLTYESESGALDESFADIFGTMVEYYAKATHSANGSGNYLCGEDMWIGGALRNLSNPNQFNQPDTYNGTFWKNTTDISNDYGGVHTNSGVQNFWFYLLSEGGSGINDNGDQYCVRGIGRDKAARIAYRNLTVYLSANSNYSNARYYSIQSAIDLYGLVSPEVQETIAAWYAVGVGSSPTSSGLGYIQLGNKTETGSNNYHYNNALRLDLYTVQPSVGVNVSSNTEIVISSTHLNPPIYPPTFGDTKIKQGSEFHAYIAPACAGGARMGNTNNDGGKSTSNEVINSNERKSEIAHAFHDINVYPNPSNGNFTVSLNDNAELPKSIIVRDVLGKEIINIHNPKEYIQNIDLKSFNNGIYIIVIYYSNDIITKRIVKN